MLLATKKREIDQPGDPGEAQDQADEIDLKPKPRPLVPESRRRRTPARIVIGIVVARVMIAIERIARVIGIRALVVVSLFEPVVVRTPVALGSRHQAASRRRSRTICSTSRAAAGMFVPGP